jgi:glutathione S-transferase
MATSDAEGYRLIYYNGRGRAECARLMLVLSGRPFHDYRVTINEWKMIKKKGFLMISR